MHVQLGQIKNKIQKDQTEEKTQLPFLMGFPDSSVGKRSPCNVGDLGSIPWLGISPGEGKGYPFQYSGLENSTDCTVHGSQRNGHDWVTFIHSLTATSEDPGAKKGCWGAKAVYYTYPQHTPPPKGKAKHPTTPAQPLDSPLSSLLISNQLAHPGSKQGDPLPVFDSPAIAGALTKPWLNFLTNLLSISTDWGRTRILVCIRSNVWSNYSIPVIYLKKTETPIWKDTWTQLFTALITIAKIWKQPKCVHQQMNW